jgi:hypothetical protein
LTTSTSNFRTQTIAPESPLLSLLLIPNCLSATRPRASSAQQRRRTYLLYGQIVRIVHEGLLQLCVQAIKVCINKYSAIMNHTSIHMAAHQPNRRRRTYRQHGALRDCRAIGMGRCAAAACAPVATRLTLTTAVTPRKVAPTARGMLLTISQSCYGRAGIQAG